MDMMKKTLCEGLPRLGLELDEKTADTLCAFGAAVVEQNKVMNLTAITEPDQVAKLHLLDSLSILAVKDLKGKKMVDVGCGAGFPGVPVKIACPEVELTLLDSLGKRMHWLETILPTLGVDANCVTARAEEAVGAVREVEGVSGMMTNLGNSVTDLVSNKKNAQRVTKGVKIDMNEGSLTMDLYLTVQYGNPIPEVAENAQKAVISAVEAMTGCTVSAVNIHVGAVTMG